MDKEQLIRLVKELAALPKEKEWVEFKVDNTNPQEIGERISAISNSVALLERSTGYIVWGIEDETHELVGTKFKPKEERVKKQEIENWLVTQLEPKVNFQIHEVEIDGKRFVIFEIPKFSIVSQVILF